MRKAKMNSKPTFEMIRQAYIEEMYEHLGEAQLDGDLYADLAKTYADENEHLSDCYLQLCRAWLEQ